MNKAALAELFYKQLQKIISNDQMLSVDKHQALQQLLNIIIIEVTQREKLQFTTLFTRYAYAANKYNLPKQLQFFLHQFRKLRQGNIAKVNLTDDESFGFGLKILSEVIEAIFEVPPTQEVKELIPATWPKGFKHPGIKAFKKHARVVILEEDQKNELLLGRDEHHPEEVIKIKYNLPDRNENFNPTIKSLRAFFEYPYILSLLDIEIDSSGTYYPRAFVIEPDFLVDVSSIAECFTGRDSIPWIHLLKNFYPSGQQNT